MNNKSDFSELLKGFSAMIQTGFSFVLPVILSVLLAVFLKDKYDVSDIWTVLIIVLGIAVGVNSFYRIAKAYLKNGGNDKK